MSTPSSTCTEEDLHASLNFKKFITQTKSLLRPALSERRNMTLTIDTKLKDDGEWGEIERHCTPYPNALTYSYMGHRKEKEDQERAKALKAQATESYFGEKEDTCAQSHSPTYIPTYKRVSLQPRARKRRFNHNKYYKFKGDYPMTRAHVAALVKAAKKD